MKASINEFSFETGIDLDWINLCNDWIATVLSFAFLVEHDKINGTIKSSFCDRDSKKRDSLVDG
jgi:hypothetical protein